MATSLEIDTDLVRNLIVQLRRWHAGEGATEQNDGSNDSDDIHDNLEMHPGHGDKADIEGIYNTMNATERADLSALLLIGMEEEDTLVNARDRISREEAFTLDDLLEMPLAPEYLGSALEITTGAEEGGVDRLDTQPQKPQSPGKSPGKTA